MAGFRDHHGVPDGVPDDGDLGGVDGREGFNFFFGIGGYGGSHTAALGCEGHFDGDVEFIRRRLGNGEVVNEAEVDDIDRNFGIVAVFECFPD